MSNVVGAPGSAVTAMCPPPPWKTRLRLVWDVSCNPNPPGPKSASACSSASRGVSGVVTWYRIASPLLARLGGTRAMPMACVSGDDGTRMEDIKASHCSASSLSQCIKQNACQLHHSHSAMHGLRYATCGGEVGVGGQRASRPLEHGVHVRMSECAQ